MHFTIPTASLLLLALTSLTPVTALPFNPTLQSRTLSAATLASLKSAILPTSSKPTDIGAFVFAQTVDIDKREMVAWEVTRISHTGTKLDGTSMNTAVFKPFGVAPIKLGLEGLCGCTSLFVISTKGVYATHWWQSNSFGPVMAEWKSAYPDVYKPYKTLAEFLPVHFKLTVLDPMDTEIKKEHASLKKNAASFVGDRETRAFLIHPRAVHLQKEQAFYDTALGLVDAHVKKTIPGLASVTRVPYEREDCTSVKLDDESAKGRVLFKYLGAKRGEIGVRKLWVEDKAVYSSV